jgi:hypothetical protein
MSHPDSPPASLAVIAAEFPGWDVTVRPAGLAVIAAYWQSQDGRHRRYIVAASSAELLAALRQAGQVTTG